MLAKVRAVVAPFAEGQWDSVVTALEEVQAQYPDHKNHQLWLMQVSSHPGGLGESRRETVRMMSHAYWGTVRTIEMRTIRNKRHDIV